MQLCLFMWLIVSCHLQCHIGIVVASGGSEAQAQRHAMLLPHHPSLVAACTSAGMLSNKIIYACLAKLLLVTHGLAWKSPAAQDLYSCCKHC